MSPFVAYLAERAASNPEELAELEVMAAAPSLRNLKRRIEMLGKTASTGRRPWIATGAAAFAALLGLLPVHLVAGPDSPAGRPATPGAATASAIAYGNGDLLDAWVYAEGDTSTSMTGSGGDWQRAMRARRGRESPFLWVRRGTRAYVIRDAALLEEARAIFAPMMELGKEQGRLGEQQGLLGEEQGKLGEQQGLLGEDQGKLGAQQGLLGARQGLLGVELARLAARQVLAEGEGEDRRLEARAEEIEAEIEDLARQQEALARQQEELARRQEPLAREQEELAGRQEPLARQQEVLGRQQEEASRKAQRALADLIERALEQGLAEEGR